MLQRIIMRLKRLRGPSPLARAQTFVGTDLVSGRLQFELAREAGLGADSSLLEIGCGSLNAGAHFIEYLGAGRYVGIDPNEWLRNVAIRKRRLGSLLREKRPVFLSGADFDASSLNRTFDFCFSHSILSHAAHWQLRQYLENVARVLTPNGRILSSIRLAEGNAYGSSGSPNGDDSRDETWVYPGVSWFRLSTVNEAARKAGLTAALKPEYTAHYTQHRPEEVHDWILFSRSVNVHDDDGRPT